VSLVNDEETPAPNYYYGTNNEGVRGWYLLSDEVGLTCETIGSCQTIIDIEAAIDDLQTEIALKADITSISAVGFSNDYDDLDNKPSFTFMWTVDFLDYQSAIFIAPYACSIDSVSNVQNAPTITITKNGSAYTLGTSIALGDDLVISANIASVVNLNISQL